MSHLEDHLLSTQVFLRFILLVLLDMYEDVYVQEKLKENTGSAGSEETDLMFHVNIIVVVHMWIIFELNLCQLTSHKHRS